MPDPVKNELKESKSDSKPEVKTAIDALRTIKEERGLAKILSCSLEAKSIENKPDPVTFILTQLNDLNYRPVKEHHHDRTLYWDPRTGIAKKREVNSKRGQPKIPTDKKYGYTKKEAVSHLPRNGKMHLFKLPHPVGLLFNRKYCDLKGEKYIWRKNVMSNNRFWLGRRAPEVRHRSISLNELLEYLRECERNERVIPEHNEMLVCLAKEALAAVFAPVDDLNHRLNALRIQQIIEKYLKIKLPVLIITPAEDPKIYSRCRVM